MQKLLSGERAEKLKKKLQNNDDIIIRDLKINDKSLSIMFVDGICDLQELNVNVIKPLTEIEPQQEISIDYLKDSIISAANCSVLKKSEIQEKLLRGHILLFIDKEPQVLGINLVQHQTRNIEEPPNSTVIRGPREGFTENIKENLSLIRKRLVSNKLKIEEIILGVRSKTIIKLVYFVDIADKEVIREIKSKLSKIKIDAVLDSNYVATMLSANKKTIFRQIGTCEKPDIACAKILEGRVILLIDGTPIALSVPYLLMEDLQSSNDYYSESHRAIFLRMLRIIGLFVSMFLPGLYIALQLYHYKVLPLKFLVTIVNTTQNLPLNPFLEVFFIIILFDILFEASLRMPKYLGIAVSIVGALILGDTAVKAGLVSPPGVMIVAMSAITIYIVPDQSSQISLLRLFYAFIGGILGFHGLILGSMFLMVYLANLDSYNTPYLAPYSPFISKDQKDFILKQDVLSMKKRPFSLPGENKTRLKVLEDEEEN